MMPAVPEMFRFGEFELNVAAFALFRAGERVKLEKIPMEVLILLATRRGALVTRADIQQSLWGRHVYVDHDAAINTAVRKIRQALGDDAERPRFVETAVGKGYRFVGTVSSGSAATHANQSAFPTHGLVRGDQEFAIADGDNVLGRDPAAHVPVDHPSVSRRHAKMTLRSGQVVLEDMGSRNGTFVDGRRIDAPVRLRHGSIIGLGPVTLTLSVRSASTVSVVEKKSDHRARPLRSRLGSRRQ